MLFEKFFYTQVEFDFQEIEKGTTGETEDNNPQHPKVEFPMSSQLIWWLFQVLRCRSRDIMQW